MGEKFAGLLLTTTQIYRSPPVPHRFIRYSRQGVDFEKQIATKRPICRRTATSCSPRTSTTDRDATHREQLQDVQENEIESNWDQIVDKCVLDEA